MEPYNDKPAHAPDKYTISPIEIAIENVRMRRTGITPPGFPIFAVYRPKAGNGRYVAGYISDKFYVYEGGFFWAMAMVYLKRCPGPMITSIF